MQHDKSILQVLQRNTRNCRIPIWFMRQAGRYLPEYREIRSKAGGFMKMVLEPNIAAEITLQPIKRFDIDAAIVFSDILMLPYAMGVDVEFHDGIGPVVQYNYDVSDMTASLGQISDERFKDITNKIAKTISIVRSYLDIHKPHIATIGFAGSPWTVACYMLERTKNSSFTTTLSMMYQYPKQFTELIYAITAATIEYLSVQINAGAEVVKIFDSWANVLGYNEFREFVIAPTKMIVNELKLRHPNITVIGFPRKCGVLYKEFSEETHVDCVSVDNALPLDWIKNNIQQNAVVQGNLDNLILTLEPSFAEGIITREVQNIVDKLYDGGFIFNLAHGVLPSTKIENIYHLIATVRSVEKQR